MTLEKPDAPVVSNVTHFSVNLSWEDSLEKANSALGVSGDNRVQVIVQQLSPGGIENWQQVHRSDR